MSAQTVTMTLTDFLLARIAEDEARAHDPGPHYAPFGREWEWCPKARSEPLGDLPGPDAPCECHVANYQPSRRALAECEAKRRIVEGYVEACRPEPSVPWESWGEGSERFVIEWVLGIMATAYRDHPDYRDDLPLGPLHEAEWAAHEAEEEERRAAARVEYDNTQRARLAWIRGPSPAPNFPYEPFPRMEPTQMIAVRWAQEHLGLSERHIMNTETWDAIAAWNEAGQP